MTTRGRALEDDRVKLRPLETADIERLAQLAKAPEIAANTFVPHPYARGDAEEFIANAQEKWAADEAFVFAVIDKNESQLVGVMGIHPEARHHSAEIGFWIGLPDWGRGLATAALRLVIGFGFRALALNRIQAGHIFSNTASGRVMQKASMRREGLRRQFILHRGAYKDVVYYAILRADWDAMRREREQKKTAED